MRRGWHSHVRRIRQRLCLHPWILFWKREVCRFHMQPERWLCRAPSILSPVEILFAPRTIPGRIGDVNRRLDERSKYVTAGAANLAARGAQFESHSTERSQRRRKSHAKPQSHKGLRQRFTRLRSMHIRLVSNGINVFIHLGRICQTQRL
jgi:hypothetical protein